MKIVNIETKTGKSQRYDAIDGMRVLACFGIILSHVRANANYMLQGSFVFDRMLPSMTWLVGLFLMISGFGMCTGYLERFQNGSIDLEAFYTKRFAKTLPFFGFLLLLNILMEHSLQALYEATVEFLMMHGFLPNISMSVLGVSWTLVVIFLFYFLFPAYSVLMKNRKRAWISLVLSVWILFVCSRIFFNKPYVSETFNYRRTFLASLPFFIGGGIIYLYRVEIQTVFRKYRWAFLALCVLSSVLWFGIPGSGILVSSIKSLVVFGLWLAYAIGSGSAFLSSKPMRFLSGISMEMYLAQMILFRVVEKAKLLYVFGSSGVGGWLSILVAFVLIVLGLIVFVQVYKWLYRTVKLHWPAAKKRKNDSQMT